MEQTKARIKASTTALLLTMILVVACGIVGCATTKAVDGREKTMWQLRDQYVRIERQDHAAGEPIAANAHPADVSAGRLRNMVESIEVRLQGEDKAVPLFNEDEVKVLSEQIHAGLLTAHPDEDVTFAVMGHYTTLLGILKEPMVTTGRVFCQNGEINIIFGDVRRPVKENEDRRLHPLLPGSRQTPRFDNWRFTSKAGGENFHVKRQDWLAFPVAGPFAPPVVQPKETGSRKEAPAPASTTGKKTIEERLKTLNELHDKKLITDEEYRGKRLEILNEL